MNKDTRQYFIVGLFVIITTIMLLAVWLWFTTNTRQQFNTFVTTFNEPVDGLSVSSLVKYSGVDVGRVQRIVLDKNNPRNIIVYLGITTNVPVNRQTTASIKSIGVTGISYIELNLPEKANLNDNITPHNNEPYPTIASKASFLSNLSEQAQKIANNIDDISLHTKKVLNEQNVEEFGQILTNLRKVTAAMAIDNSDISTIIKNFAVISDNLKNSTAKLDATLDNSKNLVDNLNNNTLGNINNVVLPTLNSTLNQIYTTTSKLEQLADTLNKNPSALIKGTQVAKPGPGEE
jgi:phospholipid/cholesterol/gamma-HCH transport system substrate-binding protein